MPTFYWVVYDIVLGLVGFWLLDRELNRNEKYFVALLAVIGLAIAMYTGYSDRQDSQSISALQKSVAELSNRQEFGIGQANVISQIDAKTLGLLAAESNIDPHTGANAVASAATTKIEGLKGELGNLQNQVKSLQTFRNAHEWPVPSLHDQQAFTQSLKGLGPHALVISCGDNDCEALSEALTIAAKGTKTWSIQNDAGGTDTVGLVGVMIECPPGKGGAFPKQLQRAIQGILHAEILLQVTPMEPPTCDLAIGRKPRSKS